MDSCRDSGATIGIYWTRTRTPTSGCAGGQARRRPGERWEAEQSFYRAHNLPPDPAPPHGRIATVAHLADLVDYLVNLVGHEHVGLSGDIGGIGADQWPLGMDHVGHLPRLTAELLGRGYDEDSLRCILSDNWRRVYRDCLPA